MRLYDDPAAHDRAVGGIAFFGTVGVQGMRVVERNEQRRGERLHKRFLRFVLRERDAFERVFEKVASRALPRARADLFVVEEGGDTDAVRLSGNRFERGAYARQIVETGRGEKFAVRAVDKGLFRGNDEQVAGKRRVFERCFAERVEGQQIGLRIGRELFVRLSVHVDRNRGNDERFV